MIYAGHHMAGKAPQKRAIFSVSSERKGEEGEGYFPPSFLAPRFARPRPSPPPPWSRFSLRSAVAKRTASHIPCSIRSCLTYYWKAIVFSRRRFSYGAAIFHRAILPDTGRARARGWRQRRENTDAFNMQSQRGGELSKNRRKHVRPGSRHLAPTRNHPPPISYSGDKLSRRSFLRFRTMAKRA